MANGSGAAIGGAAGGVLGFVGELIGQQQAKAQQTRFRRRQRAAIDQARKFATETAERVRMSDLFQRGEQFISSTFDDVIGSPLGQDFQAQIRASQAARGLFFGGGPAAAEARGLAAFAQTSRERLLPSLLQFAITPEQIRQSAFASDVNARVAAATGAPLPGITPPAVIDPLGSALRSGIQGAAGGFQLGQEFGRSTRIDGTPGGVQPAPAQAGQDIIAQLQAMPPDTRAFILQQAGVR